MSDSLYGNQARGIEGIFIHSRLDDAGLSPEAFRVFSHLARRASRAGRQAYPGIASISKVCNMAENTVRKAIRELEGRQMVVKQQGGGVATNRYLLTSFDRWTGNFEILPEDQAPLHGVNPSPDEGGHLTACTPPLHDVKGTPARGEPKGTQDKVHNQGSPTKAISNGDASLFDVTPEPPTVPVGSMTRSWNLYTPSLPKIHAIVGARLKTAAARYKQLGGTMADWDAFCQRIEAADKLTGRFVPKVPRQKPSQWKASFDWCIEPANFTKIREGKYDPQPTPTQNDSTARFF